MRVCRRIARLAVIGWMSLSLAGCGGGTPTTGEIVRAKPDEATKKKSLEGYIAKAKQPKAGKPAARKPGS